MSIDNSKGDNGSSSASRRLRMTHMMIVATTPTTATIPTTIAATAPELKLASDDVAALSLEPEPVLDVEVLSLGVGAGESDGVVGVVGAVEGDAGVSTVGVAGVDCGVVLVCSGAGVDVGVVVGVSGV